MEKKLIRRIGSAKTGYYIFGTVNGTKNDAVKSGEEKEVR